MIQESTRSIQPPANPVFGHEREPPVNRLVFRQGRAPAARFAEDGAVQHAGLVRADDQAFGVAVGDGLGLGPGQAIHQVDRRLAGQPFFIDVAYNAPHWPYQPPGRPSPHAPPTATREDAMPLARVGARANV